VGTCCGRGSRDSRMICDWRGDELWWRWQQLP
jgi:hypothetical protein